MIRTMTSAGRCVCHQCIKDGNLTDESGEWPLSWVQMILCDKCGNKRCPRANDHRNDCTDSNASGQVGSAYP